jgi:hypothetical protein
MEKDLIHHLSSCAGAYAEARNVEISTLGRLAAGDWRFFRDLAEGRKTFTARKYDEVMLWFSDNWPEKTRWPAGVPRPKRAESAA